MLVTNFIYDFYKNHIAKISLEQKKVIDKEVDSLFTWAERHSQGVVIPEKKIGKVYKVYDFGNGPIEIEMEEMTWLLEEANSNLLVDLDRKIVGCYRAMKNAGIKRPSMMLYFSYFRYIFLKDDDNYAANLNLWASRMFVSLRLHDTARIAVRYEFPDKFGSCIREDSDGATITYTKDIWREELAKRGVVPVKKLGENDGSRGNENIRREMRQVPDVVEKLEGKSKGEAGRDKSIRDANGKLQSDIRKGSIGGVQENLSLLFSPFDESRRKDAIGKSNNRGKASKENKKRKKK